MVTSVCVHNNQITLHVDGSWQINPGPTGYGGLLRDSNAVGCMGFMVILVLLIFSRHN